MAETPDELKNITDTVLSNAQSWIVGDNPDTAKSLASLLKESGGHTTLLSTGYELLDALHSIEIRPDIICLDLTLPDFSGLELLRYIKQKDPLVPVIVMTGDATTEVIVEALALGAYDYISEDSDTTKLVTTFRRAVEYRHLKSKLSSVLNALGITQQDLGLDHFTENYLTEFEPPSTIRPGSNLAKEKAFSLKPVSRQDREKQAILKSLREASGRIATAAELLGISRATLYRKMKKHHIATRGKF